MTFSDIKFYLKNNSVPTSLDGTLAVYMDLPSTISRLLATIESEIITFGADIKKSEKAKISKIELVQIIEDIQDESKHGYTLKRFFE